MSRLGMTYEVESMAEVTGEFNVKKWDEQPYAELEAGKLTRAEIEADLAGGLTGAGRVVWLMCYRADETAEYLGFVDLEVTLDGRGGGFVVSSSGTFDGERAAGPWTSVEGTGRGSLAGIRGSGSFDAPHGGTATYRLTYELG